MEAHDQSLCDFMSVSEARYVIPIYQRKYSWEISHCQRLWDDVLAIGKTEQTGASHFTGSVVWVNSLRKVIGITPNLLIDGQQRLTTVTLLLIALAEFAKDNEDKPDFSEMLHFDFNNIRTSYLVNSKKSAKGDDKYRLILTDYDRDSLKYCIDSLISDQLFLPEEKRSDKIFANLNFFREKIRELEDVNVVWDGFVRLKIVSVGLDPNIDNPQLVFESMNSTGKGLSSGDLIRNYVLMRHSVDVQERLYIKYWKPTEEWMRNNGNVFDDFMWCYLTIRFSAEIKNKKELRYVKRDEIYSRFKQMMLLRNIKSEELLNEILHCAELYAKLVFSCSVIPFEKDEDVQLRLSRLCYLDYTVDEPLILKLSLLYRDGGIDKDVYLKCLDLIESYLVRRMIVGAATNTLNKFFSSILTKLNDFVLNKNGSFYVSFFKELDRDPDGARFFPSDEEVKESLLDTKFYRHGTDYVLERIENSYHPKNLINFPLAIDANGRKKYTVEHILPQGAMSVPEWRTVLGIEPEKTLEDWLHNIGNLTITPYNAELRAGTFEKKKERMVGGYGHDGLALSSDLVRLEKWDVTAIKERRDRLIERVLELWKKPEIKV